MQNGPCNLDGMRDRQGKRGRRLRLVLAVVAGLSCMVIPFSTAFSDDHSYSTVFGPAVALEDPIPGGIPRGDVGIKPTPVTVGLTAPNGGTHAPGHPDLLFVSDQNGILWKIALSTGEKSVFLDVSARLVDLGVFGPGTFDERGFLGFAFHPEYGSNGLLYTYTSEPVMDVSIQANHQSVLTEWRVPSPGDASSVVDTGSARELLRVDEPQFNHNGGAVDFGPDGMLYVSLGDGGGADGPEGQDLSNLLGTIIRIDPSGNNSSNAAYGIPSDNPFFGMIGVREEIYAYGFRNPFRFSFDAASGDLYAGDVGQNDVEEVDLVSSGGNYGWNVKEGSFFFDPNGSLPGFVTDEPPPEVPPGLIDPIAEYDHDEGVAVIGGFVYRGTAIPSLYGKYVFGDLVKPGTGSGRLFYLENGEIFEFSLQGRTELELWVLGFARDAAGELYVLGNTTGTPFENTGQVLKIVSNVSYNLSTGLLHVPAVDVSDPTAGAVFQADMALLTRAGPPSFQVIGASVLSERFRGSGATFDFETGILALPVVDIFDALGNVVTYSAEMTLFPDPDRIVFVVTRADPTP